MTLTWPGCPMSDLFITNIKETLKNCNIENVNVEFSFDPPWNPDMMSDEIKKKLDL